MFKTEIERLKTPDWSDIALEVAVTFGISILAYVLDHARIAAFALIPSAGIFSIARSLGINWPSTPRLKTLMILLTLILWMLTVWWVVTHPRA